jgi:hypothetical protein
MKRKTVIAIAGLLLTFLFAAAQPVWNKTYIEDRPAMLFSSIIATDTSFVVLGLIADKQDPYYSRAVIGTIDSNGQFVKYRSIDDSIQANVGAFWNNLQLTNEGKYAFSGYVEDSVPRLMFCLLNRNGDSVLLFQYATPSTIIFQAHSFIQYPDNSYFITGERAGGPLSNGDIVLVKIDSEGRRIWEKYFDHSYIDYASKVIILNNGNLLLGAVRIDFNHTGEHAHTWLLEVDTGGGIVREWVDPNDSTYVSEGLMQTSDGGFIYGAQKKIEEILQPQQL